MNAEQTCWTLVQDATAGSHDARDLFARVYLPVVRAFLSSRWGAGASQLDDAVQETFVECFRENGALQRVDRSRPGKFRTFLFAVVRHVALRFEERNARDQGRRTSDGNALDVLPSDDPRASRAFDRTWAEQLLRRAAERLEQEARRKGLDALRRLELLQLRFRENLPIREIAKRWAVDAAALHHEYARAREEYKEALKAEIAFHQTGEDVEDECRSLLELLG